MPAGYVQSTVNSVAASPNITAQFSTQNCVPGNLFLAAVQIEAALASVGNFTISDDFNGSWPNPQVVAQDGGGQVLFIGYLANQQSSELPTINAAWDGGSFVARTVVEEVNTLLISSVVEAHASNTWSLSGATGSVPTPNIDISNTDYLFAALAANGVSFYSNNGAGTKPSPWGNSLTVGGKLSCVSTMAAPDTGLNQVWDVSGGPVAGLSGIVAITTAGIVVPSAFMGQVCL